MALGGVLIAIAALVDVGTIGPQVTVRWRDGITPQEREALERRHDLQNGEPVEDTATGWEYDLGDRSRDNITALVRDPAVNDTSNIDRDAMTAPRGELRIGLRTLPFPFNNLREVAQVQSLVLLLSGGVLLWAASSASERRRRSVAFGTLVLLGAAAIAVPISPDLVTMGDANEIAQKRSSFENFAGVNHIRFEAHLSYAIQGQVDRFLGRTVASPGQSQVALARAATAWFVLSALAVGFLERWSPMALRYLGLAVLAPSALLYFGWREFGYLSLNVAAFPLIARGVHDRGWRLEAGSLLTGAGAALHGLGLVSFPALLMAAFAAPGRLAERAWLALRMTAWATAAYIGWVAIYVIVLHLPIVPGHAEAIPWRHWLVEELRDSRPNVPILSLAGGRDLLFTGWVVGVPLLAVAGSLWRQCSAEVRIALSYAVPSTLFVFFFWPIQGLGEEMDLVVAAFPAIYALAWVCAHHSKRTLMAAALLVSAHLAFWRILFDERFVNPTS